MNPAESTRSDNLGIDALDIAAIAAQCPTPANAPATPAREPKPPKKIFYSPPSLPKYPEAFDVMLGTEPLTPEMYPALLEKFGQYLVLFCRFAGEAEATACVTVIGIVKLGVFGRCMKPVPFALVAPYLGADDAELFKGREDVLVCTPPMTGAQARAIAEMMVVEEAYIASKVPLFDALDVMAAYDTNRVSAAVDDLVRYFETARKSFDARVEEVAPPTGAWTLYGPGGAIPGADALTGAIKRFANETSRASPPLPPVNDSEVAALLHIHDLLARAGFQGEASRLMEEALSSPAFARLCHCTDLFSRQRDPPVAVAWHRYGPKMLQYLFSEELTHAARRESSHLPVTLEANYVLTGEELVALRVPHGPVSLEQAFRRLDSYMGGYLADLDLSRSLITGSAIAAALIITDVERTGFEGSGPNEWALSARFKARALPPSPDDEGRVEADAATPPADPSEANDPAYAEWRESQYGRGFEAYIAAHYPPTRTVPRDRGAYLDLTEFVRANTSSVRITFETTPKLSDGSLLLTVTARVATARHVTTRTAILDVESGADLDVAIDVASNEEFDRVVAGHYRVIRARYPNAVLSKVTREDAMDPRYNWAVTSRCPGDVETFRPVEFYRATFDHVVTHHVGMVSGAFTARFGGAPQFVVSSRLALSMSALSTPNYYYFASRKTAPQYIVLKYLQRGFGLDVFPKDIRSAFVATFSLDDTWGAVVRRMASSAYPAISAIGNFSAYSLDTELAACTRV